MFAARRIEHKFHVAQPVFVRDNHGADHDHSHAGDDPPQWETIAGP